MKLAVLINSNFVSALQKLKSEKLPFKAAMQVAAISKKAVSEMNTFDETRVATAKAMAEKDPDGSPILVGGNYKLSEENLKQLTFEVAEALNAEIDLGSVKMSELGDLSKISLTANDFELLEPIFETK